MQDRGQYGTMQTCLKTYENTGIIDREYGRERKHSKYNQRSSSWIRRSHHTMPKKDLHTHCCVGTGGIVQPNRYFTCLVRAASWMEALVTFSRWGKLFKFMEIHAWKEFRPTNSYDCPGHSRNPIGSKTLTFTPHFEQSYSTHFFALDFCIFVRYFNTLWISKQVQFLLPVKSPKLLRGFTQKCHTSPYSQAGA